VEQPHICFSKMDRRYLVLGGEDAAGFGMLQKDPLDLLLGCLFFVRWVLCGVCWWGDKGLCSIDLSFVVYYFLFGVICWYLLGRLSLGTERKIFFVWRVMNLSHVRVFLCVIIEVRWY